MEGHLEYKRVIVKETQGMVALLAILSNNERLEMLHMGEYIAFLITWYNGKGNFGI